VSRLIFNIGLACVDCLEAAAVNSGDGESEAGREVSGVVVTK